MKFENIRVMNFNNALHGMRNPKNSWHLSDSVYGICHQDDLNYIADNIYELYDNHNSFIDYKNNGILYKDGYFVEYAYIGPKDMKLAQTLTKSGPEHRKFLRQIFVTVDITAPLYWY